MLRHALTDWVPGSASYDTAGREASSETELLHMLRTKGFLATTAPHRPYLSDTPRPATACMPNWNLCAPKGLTMIVLLQVFWAYARTLISLRSGRMQALLRSLSAAAVRKPRDDPPSSRALQTLVTLFLKIRVWFYTAKDACLLDSFVLASVLRWHNVDAKLHIGVTLMPFSAHAWVQVGSCVVDDTVEHICEFTPILVV
jgi:hypothetical protein